MLTSSPADRVHRNLPMPAVYLALGLNLIWINLSEVFRYFIFVMPLMRDALPMVPNIAPMNLPVFLIWGIWDTVLVASATLISWLILERFGATVRTALLAGTAIWATVFVILWLGLLNMGLATLQILGVALPLAWVEMAVAALIVSWAIRRTAPKIERMRDRGAEPRRVA